MKKLIPFLFLSILFVGCASSKKNKTFTLKEPEGVPVAVSEVWGFVLQNLEDEYNPEFPITDVCYYYADLNCYGEMIDIPNRSKITVSEGTRVHFGMCCQSTSLTHFVISPEFGIRDSIIKNIVDAASDFDGLQLDFEYVPQRDKIKYLDFVRDIKAELDSRGKNQMLSVCVPGRWKISEKDIYPYKELSELCDRIFVMAYDEHWATSEPGPIASTEWSQKVADFAITQVPQEKLIMGMPLYGRTWNNKSTAKAWYFETLKRTMKENNITEVIYENDIPMFKYTAQVEVTGYFNDNYSVINLCNLYKNVGVDKIGFWRVGFESTDFWDLIQLN